MNKKIKKVIAMLTIASTFLSVAPSKYLNEFSIKAYAATTITAGDIDIESDENLDLYDSSSCKSSDKISSSSTLSESTSYYTKTSKSRVKITLSGQDDNKVRLYKGSKVYQNGRNVTVDDGSTTSIEVRIYTNDYDSYTTSEQKDSSNYDRYVIKVKNTSSSSNDDEEENDNSDSAYLYDIVLDYGQINFSKKTMSYDINVPLAIDEMRIKAKPDDDDYDVTINDDSVDEDDKWATTVSLNKGENIIKILVEDNDDNKKTYTLHIYRGAADDASSYGTNGEVDNKQDSIYLDDLLLDDGDTKLNFNRKVTSYAIDYKEAYDYILIKAQPEDDNHIVRINDDRVETDNYVVKYELKKGKNVIKIQVDNSKDYDTDEDGYEKRIYTLTVYRGTSEGTAVKTTNTSNVDVNKAPKVNQWVNNNGKWQYIDISGNALKNMWFFDKNYGGWYYLDEMGNMKTGWIQDGTGKWYYLYPNGAMAYNTSVDGYKLGSNGAWIK